MSRLFGWIGNSDKSKQGGRTGKTPERAADALAEASAIARDGDIKAATKLFEESIRIYHALGMKPDEAAANHAFALALAAASEYAAAFEAYSTSIALFRALDLKSELAAILRDAGQTHADYSDFEQASVLLNESLSLFKSLGDDTGIAGTLRALGRAAYIDESYDNAREYFGQSLDLCVRLEKNDQASLCLAYLSSIAVEENDFGSSREHYFASINQYRSTLSASPLADTLAELGEAPFKSKSVTSIEELLNAAIAIYSHARTPGSMVPAAPGMEQDAKPTQTASIETYRSDSQDALRAEASACLILAPVAYSQDRKELAGTLFDRSIALAHQVSDAELLCETLLQVGKISTHYYDLPTARRYYTQLNDAAEANDLDTYKAPCSLFPGQFGL